MGHYGYAVLVRSDSLGSDDDAGKHLMAESLCSMSKADSVPETIAFVGDGIKLPLSGDESTTRLCRTFMVRGTQILVCRESLENSGFTSEPGIGKVLPMKEIMKIILSAEKIVTL